MTSPKLIWLFIKYHFTSKPHSEPVEDEHLNVVSLGLDIEAVIEEIQRYSNDFKTKTLGEIEYKSTKLPILQIDINEFGTKKLFLLSGTHGNEQAGILAVPKLLEFFKTNPKILQDIHLRIIAPHNPIAAKFFSRFNGEGFDLNRDFKKLETKENQLVMNSMKKFQPDLTISLHEGPQENTFIFANSLVTEQNAEFVLNKLKESGVELAEKSYVGNKLKRPGYFPVVGFPLFFANLQSKLFGLNSFGINNMQLGIPNMTLETSWQLDNKEERVEAHVEFVKAVVELLKSKTELK